jgi:hypothetical protein
VTTVYHYTSFARAEAILTGVGLDPSRGQPCCHEHEPGRSQRGLRALVEPDPSSRRASPVFGDYTKLLMRLIEDHPRTCEGGCMDALSVDRVLAAALEVL